MTLPARGLTQATAWFDGDHPVLEMICDCGVVTEAVFEIDPGFVGAWEVAVTCDGCVSVHWVTMLIEPAAAHPATGPSPRKPPMPESPPDRRNPMPDQEPDTIWVVSDVAPDGTYITTIHLSGDLAFTLTRDQASRYAAAVHTAATTAEHDAAVFAQLVDSGLPKAMAATVLSDLRDDRPPLETPGPLRYTPAVSGRTHAGFVDVTLTGHGSGTVVSQWTPTDCRQHAGHVLDVAAAVDLDAAYRRAMVGLGLTDDRARALVGGLARYAPRQEAPNA